MVPPHAACGQRIGTTRIGPRLPSSPVRFQWLHLGRLEVDRILPRSARFSNELTMLPVGGDTVRVTVVVSIIERIIFPFFSENRRREGSRAAHSSRVEVSVLLVVH